MISEEFKRMQELAGIINEMPIIANPIISYAISKVDWYYIDECDEYPNGGVIPDVEEYNYPGDWERNELYIPKGTKGTIEGNKFIDETGNDVPFIPKYFDKL